MIQIIRVTEFNQKMRRDHSDWFYLVFRTLRGDERLTGWVASYKKCHFFGKTKGDAYNRCIQNIKK